MNEKDKISNFKYNNKINIEQLIKEYSKYLFKIINNISGGYLSSEDTEEIILDVFIAIWKNQDKLDDSKSIKPYISAIAHNLTKKKLSSLNSEIKFIELEENIKYYSENCFDNIENNINIEKLDKILSTLSIEEYKIFTKFYYNSKKCKEIANELDISVMKVKTKLHRIRNKIKKKLKESGGYSI